MEPAALGLGGALIWALTPHAGKQKPAELYNTNSRNLADQLAGMPKDYSQVPELGPPLPGDLGRPIVAAQAAGTDVPTPTIGAGASPADKKAVSDERLAAPPSPYVVQAGSVIAGALITGLKSDLPGQITAQVTENVYDSPTGRTLLIPRGARLVGEYDSQVTFGQERVLLAWTRLILPNGRSITLERQPGADAAGYAGVEDGVNNHWGKLFQATMLSTILSVGAEAGTSNSENNLAQAIRQGASQSFSQAGQEIIEHELNIQPTLTIRPGMPVRLAKWARRLSSLSSMVTLGQSFAKLMINRRRKPSVSGVKMPIRRRPC